MDVCDISDHWNDIIHQERSTDVYFALETSGNAVRNRPFILGYSDRSRRLDPSQGRMGGRKVTEDFETALISKRNESAPYGARLTSESDKSVSILLVQEILKRTQCINRVQPAKARLVAPLLPFSQCATRVLKLGLGMAGLICYILDSYDRILPKLLAFLCR